MQQPQLAPTCSAELHGFIQGASIGHLSSSGRGEMLDSKRSVDKYILGRVHHILPSGLLCPLKEISEHLESLPTRPQGVGYLSVFLVWHVAGPTGNGCANKGYAIANAVFLTLYLYLRFDKFGGDTTSSLRVIECVL